MLKTLTKLAKGRATIPVLNTIRIKDGIATATDMDVYVSVPMSGFNKADWDEDLTYNAHGFDKGLVFKSEIPASDFPELPTKGRVCGKTELNAAQIEAFKWVMLAQSKDKTRYYLNGIYFGAEDIVAADGHRLHSFKHPMKWGLHEQGKKSKKKDEAERTPITSAILPSGAIKIILAMIAETKAKSFSIEFHDTLHFTCLIPGGVVIEGKLVDRTFPDWRGVVPTHPKKNRTVFDPAEIKAIMPELEVLAKVSGIYHTTLAIATANGEAWIPIATPKNAKRFPVSMKLPFTAGFNIKYLTEMCGGVMEYGDSSTPFKVTDKSGGVEKIGVVMPMRI
jgi:DNA polymerase III sliding clamp (beta) subunit (PCNA family)